jgi:hypothetical protein
MSSRYCKYSVTKVLDTMTLLEIDNNKALEVLIRKHIEYATLYNYQP